MSDEIKLFPVSEWEIGVIPAYDAIFIRLAFLSHPLQKLEESDPGRRYAFQRAQLVELRNAITRALDKTAGGDAQGKGIPQH